MSWLTVCSASYRVWYAASLSLSLCDFQNRRRERRMYQLDRSSTNRWIRRAGSLASLVSSPPLEPARDGGGEPAQLREQPPVEHVALGDGDGGLRGVERVEPRVRDEERVAVPQRDEKLLHGFSQCLCTGAVVLAHLRRGVEVPAHGIRAEVVEQEVRVQHIAARLRRLLALRVDHEAQADHVAVGVLLEEQRRDRQQGVEPASRLVHRLGDEVSGKGLLELLFAVPRIAALRERHRT